MNLIENEEENKRRKNTKTIMIIIVALIVFLLIVCMVLLFLIDDMERNTLKLNIDNKSTKFSDKLFVFEGDKMYVAIKEFGSLLGYTPYNGDYKNSRYSESTTECYISNANETASYSLNSSTMYKKAALNEDYEYFELDEPVRRINNELYVSQEGIEIGTNCLINYDASNNQITVLSLDYITTAYTNQYTNSVALLENADFNNIKALRYGLVVFVNQDKYYGVFDVNNNREVIGAKYINIVYNEGSQEFTVTTDENKMGILSTDGRTKIEPNYDEIKQISTDLDYYLVSNDEKYGVINHNGNVVIHLEYDQIGVDASRFNSNGLDNPYVLFDNCIPVMQNDKWGLFDVNGNSIISTEYDNMGCIIGTQADVIGSNVLVIPQYEAIVIGKNGKYTIINSLGKEYVPLILDSVFSQRVSGEDKYYMTYTWPLDENGEATEESETFTYDVDQYFELYIVPRNPDMSVGDTNTMTNTEVTDTNLVIDQNIVTNVAIDSNVTTETNTVSSN